MIYKATKLIKQEMDKQGLKYSIEEFDNSSVVFAGFGIEKGANIRVQFVSQDNDNDVAIRLYGLVNNVGTDKLDKVLRVINECNMNYRYVKFVLDKDRDINIEYDIPMKASDATVGAEACEVFIRIMKIADECYPKIMSALWS